jgi:hypothetical protein
MKVIFHSFVGFATIALLLSLLMLHSSAAQLQQQQQPASAVSSQHQFTASTTAKQVVDAYKAGVPFKNYIAVAIKNRESPGQTIIKNQLSSGNVMCGGSDAVTKTSVCDGIIPFAKLACEDDPTISANCSHPYINQYITQRGLDAQAINKGAYKQLAHMMADAHPEVQGNDAIFELR